MANNIAITQGSGTASVATEQIGTVQYQKIKVVGGETGSTSVMGVNPDRSINVSVIGSPAFTFSGSGSIVAIPVGSVIAYVQNSVATVIIGGSVAATFTPPANQSVSGAVTAPPGSVMAVRMDAASVLAIVQGSVLAVPTGSQSVSGATTAPPGSVQAVRTDAASVIAISTNVGSTIAVLQAPSIVGTYAEDSAAASADKGLFVLGVRNELMPSITSADLDYSPIAVGPAGEVLTANSPITKWVSGQSSVMYGTSVQVIPVGGTSVFNYLTGLQIANDSGTYSRVKITGGLGSVMAWTVAPGNGGSNIVFPNPLRTGENSGISVSISGVSSVYVTMEGFTAKI